MPFVIFCIYVFVLVGRPQDYVPALGPLRLALVFTVLTALVTLAKARERTARAFFSVETQLYLLFLVVMCVGIPFSTYRRASFNFVVMSYVVNVVFYLTFLAHVTTRERLNRVIGVLVIASFVFNVVWISTGESLAGRYDVRASMYDPNDVAFVEVSLLSFGMCVALGTYPFFMKAVAAASVLLSILLALLSGSRGGAIGLGVWATLFLVVRMATVSRLKKVVLLALAVVMAVANSGRMNVERFQTLGNLENDYNLSDEYGRGEIWRKALRLTREHPLTGVGVDCFARALGLLRERLGIWPPIWQAPHNAYLQVMTETGIPGGTIFVLLVVVSVAGLNRARKRLARGPQGELATHSALLVNGAVATAISGFFLTQGYSIFYTLYFAIAATERAMDHDLRKGTGDA